LKFPLAVEELLFVLAVRFVAVMTVMELPNLHSQTHVADELMQSIQQQVEYLMDESNDGHADSSAPSTQHGIESGSLINQHHYYVHFFTNYHYCTDVINQ
jgi:hypothetical protein